jgi:hypothetical protein
MPYAVALCREHGVAIDPFFRPLFSRRSWQRRLRRAVGVYSAGRIVNPITARAQMTGGIIWGWGKATMEESDQEPVYGRWLAKNLSNVAVPVNADIPSYLDVSFVDEFDEAASLIGARGIGELGATVRIPCEIDLLVLDLALGQERLGTGAEGARFGGVDGDLHSFTKDSAGRGMPGLLKTEAIVLRSIRYGEADRILHLYTPDHGRVSAIAKGARRSRSRFGARLEPFFHVRAVLHQGRSDLLTVTAAERAAMKAVIDGCPNTFAAPTPTTSPPPMPTPAPTPTKKPRPSASKTP